MADERPGEGYLPPEPPGPEPELGGKEQQQPPPPPPGYPAPPPGQSWPPPGQGWQQPAQGWQQQPAPGWQQPGWPPPVQPPPGQPWGWAPAPAQPDNNPAVAGFVLSMVSAGLWLFSAGLSSIVSIVCAALGIVYSRRGKRRVAAGETQKHKGLAQAGFISGIVMVVLSTLSTLFWVLFAVVAATDEEVQRDLEREFDPDSTSAALRVLAAAALRLLLGS
jgi:hypothetical protein